MRQDTVLPVYKKKYTVCPSTQVCSCAFDGGQAWATMIAVPPFIQACCGNVDRGQALAPKDHTGKPQSAGRRRTAMQLPLSAGVRKPATEAGQSGSAAQPKQGVSCDSLPWCAWICHAHCTRISSLICAPESARQRLYIRHRNGADRDRQWRNLNQ